MSDDELPENMKKTRARFRSEFDFINDSNAKIK